MKADWPSLHTSAPSTERLSNVKRNRYVMIDEKENLGEIMVGNVDGVVE